MKKSLLRVLAAVMAVMLLAGCGGSSNTSTIETGDTGYSVLVVDENSTPVKGVTLQFCTDTRCVLGETGADGVAEFEAEEPGKYTIHILVVPEGYEKDETEYVTEDSYSRIELVLKGSAEAAGDK